MRNPFWNQGEERPRGLWRLIGQVILMILLMMAVGALLGEQRTSQIGQGVVALLGIGGSVLLAARWFDHRPIEGLGLKVNRAWWVDFAFGCVLGIVLMSAIFGFELALGWVNVLGTLERQGDDGSVWPFFAALFFFLCVGITEEVWMRGYILPNVAEAVRSRRVGPRSAVVAALVLAAAIFALLHLANPNASAVSTMGIFVAGVVLGLPFVWTGSLAIPIGLHFTWNAAQGLVFGFPVSGIVTSPSVIQLEQEGPRWWTGGPFGPEAGLLSIVVLLLGAALLYGWVTWRSGHASVMTALAIPPQADAGGPILEGRNASAGGVL